MSVTTHTHTYDPDAIAAACLREQLDYLTDMDSEAIADAAGAHHVLVPDDGDEEGWDRVASAISQLADRVREHFGLSDEEVPA